MADVFDHEYPYSDYHELNLTWIITKIQELNKNLDSLEARVLEASLKATKEYVDERMLEVITDFNELSQEVANLSSHFEDEVARLEGNYETFITAVRYQLDRMTDRIEDFNQIIENDIIGVNALTDLKIQQNNEYILNEVAKGVINVKVINFFTGERITVQDMFDYLCGLHATDTPTVQEMIDSGKTVQELIDLNHTVGDWVMYGKQYVVI